MYILRKIHIFPCCQKNFVGYLFNALTYILNEILELRKTTYVSQQFKNVFDKWSLLYLFVVNGRTESNHNSYMLMSQENKRKVGEARNKFEST